MYSPEPFQITDTDTINLFLNRYDFVTLISSSAEGFSVTHVPVAVRRDGQELVLVGHVAKSNSHWKLMDGVTNALAIFHGPDHYVSPTWYVNQPAVPTWNYAVVHAHGRPKSRADSEFIESVLAELLVRYEGNHEGSWWIEDQPSEFYERQVSAVMALEMPILKIEVKFKLGQNRPAEDRYSTIAGLDSIGSPRASALAALMRASLNH